MTDTTILNPEVLALFERVTSLMDGDGQDEFFGFIGERVGTMAEGFAREVPERQEGVPLPAVYTLNGKQSKFKSRKQQGFVMRLAHEGKIPGTRSGQLANSMTHEVTVLQGGAIVAVGTNLQGAEYVLDVERQNRYLAMLGWVPLQTRMDRRAPEIRDEIVNSGQAFMSGYIAGKK